MARPLALLLLSSLLALAGCTAPWDPCAHRHVEPSFEMCVPSGWAPMEGFALEPIEAHYITAGGDGSPLESVVVMHYTSNRTLDELAADLHGMSKEDKAVGPIRDAVLGACPAKEFTVDGAGLHVEWTVCKAGEHDYVFGYSSRVGRTEAIRADVDSIRASFVAKP